MRWLSRFFEERYTLLRLLLLDLSGLGYLVFHPTGQPASAGEWAVAGAAFTAALLLYRYPLACLLSQAAGLFAAHCFGIDDTISTVGSTWMLLELALRATRPVHVAVGGGVLCGVYLFDMIGDPLPEIVGEILGLGPILALAVLFGFTVRTSRELARRAQDSVLEEQRRLASEARAARAHERSTIARELHDVVAHHVASMVLRVGVARHVLPETDPRVTAVLDDVHGTGTAALADLRQLVAVLRDAEGPGRDAALTAIEPGALPAALGAAVERARGTGLTVDTDIAPGVGTLDAVRGLAVLRLTQEALTNVAKHAGPGAAVRLRVAVDDDVLRWEVTDDGGSGPAPRSALGGGHGITGMRERVEVLGGRLEAGRAGSGWRLATVLPPGVAAP